VAGGRACMQIKKYKRSGRHKRNNRDREPIGATRGEKKKKKKKKKNARKKEIQTLQRQFFCLDPPQASPISGLPPCVPRTIDSRDPSWSFSLERGDRGWSLACKWWPREAEETPALLGPCGGQLARPKKKAVVVMHWTGCLAAASAPKRELLTPTRRVSQAAAAEAKSRARWLSCLSFTALSQPIQDAPLLAFDWVDRFSVGEIGRGRSKPPVCLIDRSIIPNALTIPNPHPTAKYDTTQTSPSYGGGTQTAKPLVGRGAAAGAGDGPHRGQPGRRCKCGMRVCRFYSIDRPTQSFGRSARAIDKCFRSRFRGPLPP
jgi:hypothetical protein